MKLPVVGQRVLVSWVEDIRDNPRYEDKSFTVELGEGEYRHVARGGFWNDRDGRASYGVTKSDVDGCRIELKRAGIVLTFDAVDALLAEAVCVGTDAATPEPVSAADRKKAQRDRWRAAGLCIICGQNPVPSGRSTCKPCGDRANKKREKAAGA